LAGTIDGPVEKKRGPEPTASAFPPRAVFVRSGEYWTVGYAGATSSLKDVKGFSYIERLLRYPGEEFHALDLLSDPKANIVSDNRDATSLLSSPGVTLGGLGDAGEMLDEQAKREYKRRLSELREQADDLLDRGAHDRASEVESEIEFLQREIARAVGLGGRDRRAGSAAERARLSVTRAIRGALQKISEHNSELGATLETSIRTGSFCSYVPDFRTNLAWRFSLEPPDSFEPERPSTLDDARKTVFFKGETGLLQSFARGTSFVGRELEIDILRHVLGKSVSGEGRIVLISGCAGVGKTRLAAEIGVEASKHGTLTLVGNCYDREDSVPFLPFVEILEAALARAHSPESFREIIGSNASEIARLLPELRRLFPDIPPPLDLSPEQSRRVLFNAVADFFGRLATEQTLLLFFDDLHWADEGTLSLLNHLARSVAQLPVAIAGAYRDTETDAARPLAKALDELIHLQVVHRIHLTGLQKDAASAMVRALSGRDVPEYLADLIFKETEGNPFFIEELYRHLDEDGKLYDSAGEFRLDLRSDEIDVPRSVRLVIDRRLARLSSEAQKILSTAGIIGRSFTFGLLEASTGIEAEGLLDRVEEAERTGLINSAVEYPEAKFYFSHELVRRATIDTLSSARRQRIHLNVANAIERLYSDTLEDHVQDLVHHLWQAGSQAQVAKTIHFLTIAAKQEVTQNAFDGVLRHLKNAQELLKKLPDLAERKLRELDIQIDYANALVVTKGNYAPEVGEAYERARKLSVVFPDRNLQSFSVTFGLWMFHISKGHHLVARRYAEEALSIAMRANDDGLLAGAYSILGNSQFYMGEFAAAHSSYEKGLAHYDARKHRRLARTFGQDAGLSCLCYDAMALWMLGFPDQAAKKAEEAMSLARGFQELFDIAWCTGQLAMYYLLRLDLQRAHAVIDEGLPIAENHQFSQSRTALRLMRFIGLTLQGKTDSRMVAGLQGGGKAPYELAGTWGRAAVAQGLLASGRTDAAPLMLNQARDMMERNQERYFEAEIDRIQGETSWMQAESCGLEEKAAALIGAEKRFLKALHTARAQEAKMLELRAATSLGRLMIGAGKAAEAAALVKGVYDWFTEGFDSPELVAARAMLDGVESVMPIPAAKRKPRSVRQ
jgi:hypothetical protein